MRNPTWLLLAALLGSSAMAQGALPAGLEGAFALTHDERERAIEALVHELPFYKRGVARARLLEATRPCSTVEIAHRGEQIALRCDDRPVAADAPDDHPVLYVGDDGRPISLSIRVDGDRILQTFEITDGVRTNEYALDDDGARLVIHVTVASDRLGRALRYSTHYRRTAPGAS
jgi:hypothetical protein